MSAAYIFAVGLLMIIVIPIQCSNAWATAQNDSDNIWYFGKGIKPNSYLMYVADDDSGFSPTGASHFYFAIYFDRFNNNTNSWTGRVFANQNDKVSTNDFTYFLNREAKGTEFSYNAPMPGCAGEGCQSPEQIFSDSAARAYDQIFGPFQWYVKYPGKNLTDSKWISEDNPLASVNLNGTKMINVDAGTFNCTELVNSGGDVAWINKDLPFPVAGSYFRGLSGSSLSDTVHRYYLNYHLIAIGKDDVPTVPEFQPEPLPFILAIPIIIAIFVARVSITRRIDKP